MFGLLVAVASGCGGDGDGTGRTGWSTTVPGTSLDAGATTTPSACPAGPEVRDGPPPGTATVEVRAGNGPAVVWVEPSAPDDPAWTLVAAIGGGEARTAVPIEDRTAEPEVLGGHDIDGDGSDEVFLRLGQGAAATVVGLATITAGCEVEMLTGPQALPAYFPVGASAATQRGLSCEDGRLVELSGQTDDGRRYDWTATTFALEGSALSPLGSRSGTYDAETDGDEILRLGSLRCGDVTL